MTDRAPDELCAGYEALRLAATGLVVSDTPRGLALFLAHGMPAWMRAQSPLPLASSTVFDAERPVATGLGQDVVRVLTEMALGCHSRLVAS